MSKKIACLREGKIFSRQIARRVPQENWDQEWFPKKEGDIKRIVAPLKPPGWVALRWAILKFSEKAYGNKAGASACCFANLRECGFPLWESFLRESERIPHARRGLKISRLTSE